MGSFRHKILIPAGTRFGRLTVVEQAPKDRWRAIRWICRCDCGATTIADGSGLRRGCPKSCGCLIADTAIARSLRHGETRKGARSVEWSAWSSMIYWCHQPGNRFYYNYGGRGIVVCDRWRMAFENFLQDMGRKPSPSQSLERIDNNGPYSPENCRWADSKSQGRNRRISTILEHNGERMALSVWAERVGIPARLLSTRIHNGWTAGKALTTAPEPRKRYHPLVHLTEQELSLRLEHATSSWFLQM